jgi:hypothetical protein
MGRALGFIVLVAAVGVGAYIYSKQAQSVTSVGSNPQTTVDVTAVRSDLLALAKAEQNYFASNGKYVSLDGLRGELNIPSRPNFSYSAETSDSGFKITAAYSGPDSKAPKRMVVDQTMTVTIEE